MPATIYRPNNLAMMNDVDAKICGCSWMSMENAKLSTASTEARQNLGFFIFFSV